MKPFNRSTLALIDSTLVWSKAYPASGPDQLRELKGMKVVVDTTDQSCERILSKPSGGDSSSSKKPA